MALLERKTQLSQNRKPEKLSKPPKPPPKKEDLSIFKGRPYLTREQLREELRRASPFIPGSGGKMFSREERARMEKELFPERKYAHHIDRKEVKKVIGGLESAKFKAKTGTEKLNIDRKLRFLKGLLK